MDARLLVAGLVVLAGAGLAVAGASPQQALSPSEALSAEPGTVTVKGTVAEVDRSQSRFVLTDGEGALEVLYEGVLPSAVEANSTLVAEGTLDDADPTVLHADEIKIGCPSSYEG